MRRYSLKNLKLKNALGTNNGAVALAHRDQTLATANDAGIKFFDDQFVLGRQIKSNNLRPHDLRFSPNGRLIASTSHDKSNRLYDLSHRYQPQ